MELDRNGMEVLGRRECLYLMSTTPVGRVGISSEALPAIFPVNFALWNVEVVIRTAAGSKLCAALEHAVVAFEVDGWDADSHSGWSVLVRGRAREITDTDEIDTAFRLPLRPWANEGADHFAAIRLEVITGRRIHGWYHLAESSWPTVQLAIHH